MAYITLNNLRKISRNIIADKSFETEAIYKNEIYFFNAFEKKQLSALKSLIENPSELISSFYTPINGYVDKQKYVFEEEGQTNAYHSRQDCRLLHNPYTNVKLPVGLKEAGVTIKDFRKWFTNDMKRHFELKKYDVIIAAVKFKYGVTVHQNDFITFENSDSTFVNNYSLTELEQDIDKRIKSAGRYYYDNISILKPFSLKTYLAYKEEIIEDNETGLSDQDLKIFLKDYDKRFKEPVKTLLIEWYKIKFNPEMHIEGSLLEQLNFKPCSCCVGKHHKTEDVQIEKIKDTQILTQVFTDETPLHIREFTHLFNEKYAEL